MCNLWTSRNSEFYAWTWVRELLSGTSVLKLHVHAGILSRSAPSTHLYRMIPVLTSSVVRNVLLTSHCGLRVIQLHICTNSSHDYAFSEVFYDLIGFLNSDVGYTYFNQLLSNKVDDFYAGRVNIISGPNYSGKSIYAKQVIFKERNCYSSPAWEVMLRLVGYVVAAL